MDFIMNYRMVPCLPEGLVPDMGVYDAAAWSAPGPLSVTSVLPRDTTDSWPLTALSLIVLLELLDELRRSSLIYTCVVSQRTTDRSWLPWTLSRSEPSTATSLNEDEDEEVEPATGGETTVQDTSENDVREAVSRCDPVPLTLSRPCCPPEITVEA